MGISYPSGRLYSDAEEFDGDGDVSFKESRFVSGTSFKYEGVWEYESFVVAAEKLLGSISFNGEVARLSSRRDSFGTVAENAGSHMTAYASQVLGCIFDGLLAPHTTGLFLYMQWNHSTGIQEVT